MTTPALTEKRLLLLERLLRTDSSKRSPVQLIPRRNPDRPVPLSFSQERLWFLDKLALGSQFYVENSAVRIPSAIEPALLERAINAVVSRHEILRSIFTMHEGEPVQAAVPELHVPLAFIDLSHLSSSERELEMERIALQHAMLPFDLSQPPPLRTCLLKLRPADYAFLLSVHHIVTDGWSMQIFNREVSQYYTAIKAGRELRLPPLPIQYFDYAAWQRENLRSDAFERELSYWRKQLEDVPEVNLPLDHQRPRALSYAGSHLDVRLPAHLSACLRALSRREQATLFMTSLAVFTSVIGIHTGQNDLVIGTPVAGRNRAELEPLIGFFLNTVVLRIDLSGDPSFSELLKRIKRVAMTAYDHQDVPFDLLVQDLQPDRDLGKNPLFQILFQFFTPPNEKTGASTMTPDTVAVDRGTAILDQAWHFWDSPQGICGRIEYSTELFELQTIERLFEHFTRVLAAVAVEPHKPISQLEIIAAGERDRLLREWQGEEHSWPAAICLPELFAQRVAESPAATAIREGTRQVSRAELFHHTNRLANYLSELGVRRNDRVAICLDRSAGCFAAAMAVMTLGAAYVPLDPAYPIERLRYILEDSRAVLLISTEQYAEALPPGENRVVLLDADAGIIESHSTSQPPLAIDPLDVAYVIYTSGSTGKPKGVAGTHGATMNRFQWMYKEFPFEHGEVMCQRTALSFVDSIWEMFGPVLAGVPLVVVPEEISGDVGAMVSLLAEHKVTRLLTVPSLLLAMLESGLPSHHSLPNLQRWFTSGELLPADLVRRFRKALPRAELINLYGSSEVAGDILFTRVEPTADEERVPIGRPMTNSTAYVLNENLSLVPAGVAGDLFVAGPNLARGYLDQPALTAERFIPNPFSTVPGARMYATGDRVRHLPDGRIEFLGRKDQQVKLRGFRIELAEVETALRAHPAVSDVAVELDKDVAGGTLVAYVVNGHQEISTAELRAFAGSKLPPHMVPGRVVMLETLPLTPNGKLNRKALPKEQPVSRSAEFVAPQTDAEIALASIWADLLTVSEVGLHDNFFDLGGHSLLAIRLVSRLRDELGVEVQLREVFLNPILFELATVIETRLLDEIEALTDEEAGLRAMS